MYAVNKLGEGTYQFFTVKKAVFGSRSKFQDIWICVLEDFGKSLFLDQELQSTEADHEIFHSALTGPVLGAKPDARSLLIIGSGEGVAARNALRANIPEVIMVDIDPEVVEACKRYLPEFHGGALSSPQLKLVYSDGLEYLARCEKKFDMIIVDATDPERSGVSNSLYSEMFYHHAKRALTESGVFVTQAGSAWYRRRVFEGVGEKISSSFEFVRPYEVLVTSFGSRWGFYVATNNRDSAEKVEDVIIKSGYERKGVT
jgi:spermidine synthase